MFLKKILLLALVISTQASANMYNIWATIPFIRGADLCQYKQAFSQTRNEYMREMVGLASELMSSGAKGKEALEMLLTFDALYDKNLALAKQYQYLDVTLENTLKGYLDQYYTTFPVVDRKLQFKHINDIRLIVNAAANGQRIGNMPNNPFGILDYVAYGTYAYAPDCKGTIDVTLTLVGPNGDTKTYKGLSRPHLVMSQIASRMFEDFQRTKFPSKLDLGSKTITLLGATNRSVSQAGLKQASRACKNLGGRLPTGEELEDISAFGDWNGGVSIGEAIWAISDWGGDPMVYHPGLMNPSPIRNEWEVNDRIFKYYCVK